MKISQAIKLIESKTGKKVIFEDKLPGGVADNKTIEDISKEYDIDLDYLKKQLSYGINIEFEHTRDKDIAQEIALDHLSEDPEYYKKLTLIENITNEQRISLPENIRKCFLSMQMTFFDKIEEKETSYLIFLKKGKRLTHVPFLRLLRLKKEFQIISSTQGQTIIEIFK